MLLSDRKNRPWIVLTSALAIGAVAWYAAECGLAGRRLGGGSRPGLAFGLAGGLICLFEMLLWPRKALRRWGQTLRLGWTQSWMRAHVWLGLLSLPLLVMHGGVFPWGGPLSAILMVLFLVVIASGVWGLAMQQVLPRRLLDEVPDETIASQIDFVRAQLRAEAQRLVSATCGMPAADDALGAFAVAGKPRAPSPVATAEPVPGSDALRDAFQQAVAPYLCPDPLYGYYRQHRQGRPPAAPEPRRSPLGTSRSAARFFDDVKRRLDPRAHPAVDDLARLCDRRRQFAHQARLQAWLHNWLAVHLPLSVALILLMLVHAVVALRYL